MNDSVSSPSSSAQAANVSKMSSAQQARYAEMLKGVSLGKRLPDAIYLHRSLLTELPQALRSLVFELLEEVKDPDAWSVIKFSTQKPSISLLDYPGFDEEAFPRLSRSRTTDLVSGESTVRRYPDDDRALILHRKELLVPENYLLREEFELITKELEEAGLFKDTQSIGRLGVWKERLKAGGYELVDGRLLRSDLFSGPATWQAQRARTAIARSAPSLPVQMMHQWGWLDGSLSVLDYGCGRGDDLFFLEHIGVECSGWDPGHRPDGERRAADLVNLGYVINVIEDADERALVIDSAFKLARKALVVSAMIASPSQVDKFRHFRDGVVTSRGTFQKYFSQTELKEFVEAATGREAIGLAPGVVVAFRDDAFRERFSETRFRRRERLRLNVSPLRTRKNRSKAARLFEEHRELCDAFWESALDLGRWPEPDEFDQIGALADLFGSTGRAVRAIERFYDLRQLDAAAQGRKEDLLVGEAVALLARRPRKMSDFSPLRQREIKHFFSSYRELQQEVAALLRAVADPEARNAAATACDRRYCGGAWDRKGLSVERRCVERLPTVLRCFVELGGAYHGGLEGVDVVRVHFGSGKLTLTSYDDFYGKALPLLTSRTKVDLRRQRIDDFEYGEGFASPPLYWKSRFLAEDAPNLEKQRKFDDRLDELGLAPDGDPRFGFSAAVVDEILTAKGMEIKGFRFFKLG